MKIDVYHNMDSKFGAYTPFDKLVHVATLNRECKDDEALAWTFHTLNVGDDPSFTTDEDTRSQARAYRARGNRSLSVGDVVVIDGMAYACARFGWDAVSLRPEQVSNVGDYGTTPLSLSL